VSRPGEEWVVIGNARYQRGARASAVEAFEQAARFAYSRRNARGWLDFIEGEIQAEIDQQRVREQIARDEVRILCERRARGTDLLETSAVINPRTGQEVDCDAILNGEDEGGSIE
jgi:sarcosine oxidase delta subunit